ncbi:ABC transporter permease [Chengkuizengella axinellae]|uniref:ABC transporter permease n=1 Tax=Chengkuizengella axinellae TaxID=3064388 RepID=A0ABT9IZ84_9BACL|nr:ABC transporter permease [Chengkuizengella sp. 2205SS18-9]MDP5274528.1 ABC transporter permease [Chengkuizengella sp. 2205SS18-9]
MLNLVQNENMKLYLRIRTWIMVGLLVLIQIIFAFFLENTVFSWLAFADVSSYLTSIIAIYAIVTASSIVASEFSSGTIKMLLIRPVSRTKILMSKYISVLLYISFLLILNLLTSFIIGFIFFGSASASNDITLGTVLQNYGFTSIELLMTATFAFMISSLFRSSVLSIILSFIIHFFSSTVVLVLSQFNYTYGKFFLYSNTDLRQYFYGNQTNFEGMTLTFSIFILIVYFVLFHFVSLYAFKKRDVVV